MFWPDWRLLGPYNSPDWRVLGPYNFKVCQIWLMNLVGVNISFISIKTCCQAQSQLQLSWTEFSLNLHFSSHPTPPPKKYLNLKFPLDVHTSKLGLKWKRTLQVFLPKNGKNKNCWKLPWMSIYLREYLFWNFWFPIPPSPLPTGRQPCRKTTLQEDELKRRQTQRKTSKQENNLTVRQEDDFSLPS